MDGIQKSGFILGKATYSSARDGQIANGKFTISNVHAGKILGEFICLKYNGSTLKNYTNLFLLVLQICFCIKNRPD